MCAYVSFQGDEAESSGSDRLVPMATAGGNLHCGYCGLVIEKEDAPVMRCICRIGSMHGNCGDQHWREEHPDKFQGGTRPRSRSRSTVRVRFAEQEEQDEDIKQDWVGEMNKRMN